MRMSTLQTRNALDRILDPVRDILTPEVAERFASLRADDATQALIDDLADRHHEGKLSAAELDEYESLVNAVNLISVLQAKARSIVTPRQAP
jgi:hypothetical protein